MFPGNNNTRPAENFASVTGTVSDIVPMGDGCFQMITVMDRNGSVTNFVAGPDTYFVDHVRLSVGMEVQGFYDTSRPAILIYPPQFQAVVMARVLPNRNVTVGWFGFNLVNRENTLKLNVSNRTRIVLENGQDYMGSLQNRLLTVVYGATTRSIPAQTTPSQIVVMCRYSNS